MIILFVPFEVYSFFSSSSLITWKSDVITFTKYGWIVLLCCPPPPKRFRLQTQDRVERGRSKEKKKTSTCLLSKHTQQRLKKESDFGIFNNILYCTGFQAVTLSSLFSDRENI